MKKSYTNFKLARQNYGKVLNFSYENPDYMYSSGYADFQCYSKG